MRRISFAIVLLCSTGSPADAQRHHSGGGVHTFPGTTVIPFAGRTPPPVSDFRHNTIPMATIPVGRPVHINRFGPFRTFGGFGYFDYSYDPFHGYPSTTFQFDNGTIAPSPFFPARRFADLPPLPSEHPTTALLTLQVPLGAEVWLQGAKREAGTSQTFESPELQPNEVFTFDVRVAWTEKGKLVEEKRTLPMRAGEHQSLQYLAQPDRPRRVER